MEQTVSVKAWQESVNRLTVSLCDPLVWLVVTVERTRSLESNVIKRTGSLQNAAIRQLVPSELPIKSAEPRCQRLVA
jgi:hypothetical protein